ncbi:unnamed protein product [Protopolystoma xenopodis]|uniref:Uncharacterized protein n=1 Tax=Protopolystoma xenopodis TaxID=117903 RepID=A0A3S5B0R1_9PLAT|nr:unnamed protein product [Protopolystoma xenopodis]
MGRICHSPPPPRGRDSSPFLPGAEGEKGIPSPWSWCMLSRADSFFLEWRQQHLVVVLTLLTVNLQTLSSTLFETETKPRFRPSWGLVSGGKSRTALVGKGSSCLLKRPVASFVEEWMSLKLPTKMVTSGAEDKPESGNEIKSRFPVHVSDFGQVAKYGWAMHN